MSEYPKVTVKEFAKGGMAVSICACKESYCTISNYSINVAVRTEQVDGNLDEIRKNLVAEILNRMRPVAERIINDAYGN
jgi:hypothetical protein